MINRPFEVTNESSLLHFDIEWYTPFQDPTANNWLDVICSVINSALPSSVGIIRENLSRLVPNNIFKNSYHLYASITKGHNAKDGMKTFVLNNI